MGFKFRRVVTGHDDQGRAVIAADEVLEDAAPLRPGAMARVIWTTEGFPVTHDETDGGLRPVSTAHPNGTVFRIIEYAPGVTPRMHRTDSIDYGVVLSGQITMGMDVGSVTLKAGDVLVQRGTIHNWINEGDAPCVIAFVLIAAHPAQAGESALPPIG